MRHAPRLAAIDLDGTLLRSDGTVSDRSRAALTATKDAGVDVVLVTARSPRSVRGLAADLGLDGLALCANGATVFDLDAGVIVQHDPLSVDIAHRVVRGLREQVPGIGFAWELELRFGSEPDYETSRDHERWPRPDGSFPPCDALAWREPMTKLLARVDDRDLASVLAATRALCGDEAEVTIAGDTFVEVLAPGISKEAALVAHAEARGLTRFEVVAFGDQLADAGMLRWAGLGVAPANASPFALEAADEVSASNDEDGVAIVLERLLPSPRAGRPSARSRR